MDVATATLPGGKAGIKRNERNLYVSFSPMFKRVQFASEQVP